MNRSASLTLTADDCAAANQLRCVKCFRTPSALACLAMLVLAYIIWMTIAYIDRWRAIGVIALNAILVAVVALLIANFFVLTQPRTFVVLWAWLPLNHCKSLMLFPVSAVDADHDACLAPCRVGAASQDASSVVSFCSSRKGAIVQL
jgi:hypothetical protein